MVLRELTRGGQPLQSYLLKAPMVGEFKGGDVNAVLRLVRSLSADGDVQLSILTIALVTACRSAEVSKGYTLQVIEDAFDDQTELVPLDSPAAAGS